MCKTLSVFLTHFLSLSILAVVSVPSFLMPTRPLKQMIRMNHTCPTTHGYGEQGNAKYEIGDPKEVRRNDLEKLPFTSAKRELIFNMRKRAFHRTIFSTSRKSPKTRIMVEHMRLASLPLCLSLLRDS